MAMRMSPAPWFSAADGGKLHAGGDAPPRGLARDPARRREGDLDGQAALRQGSRGDSGAVSGGDRVDDGQAKAVAMAGA